MRTLTAVSHVSACHCPARQEVGLTDAIRALRVYGLPYEPHLQDAKTCKPRRFRTTNDLLLARVMLEAREATGQDVYLEFMFHPTRRWRFDGAIPGAKVAVEVEGMVGRSGKSRHTTYGGYQKDIEKYTAAEVMGWHVLRFTWKNVRDGSATKQIVECVNRLKGG